MDGRGISAIHQILLSHDGLEWASPRPHAKDLNEDPSTLDGFFIK